MILLLRVIGFTHSFLSPSTALHHCVVVADYDPSHRLTLTRAMSEFGPNAPSLFSRFVTRQDLNRLVKLCATLQDTGNARLKTMSHQRSKPPFTEFARLRTSYMS